MSIIGAWVWVALAAGLGCHCYQIPCNRSRRVFTESWGIVTHGPIGSNYTQDSHCEWLIKANSSEQFINLRFLSMGTECSYDYIYIYDGDSFNSTLLGSFSGKTEPQELVASSGFMLILLYSDTNYVLEGFRAEYSVTDCRGNCSNHGECLAHRCVCEADWAGPDCGAHVCPDDCGGSTRGQCKLGRCHCKPGYSGLMCSLDKNDTVGNKWHWLFSGGLKPRVSHTSVYIKETDSLYVFGGYNLNSVLGDLSIFRFNTSIWEDEDGNILPRFSGTSWGNELDSRALKVILDGVGGVHSDWNLPKSYLKNAFLAITDNKTFPLRSYEPRVNRRVDNTLRPVLQRSRGSRPSPRYSHAASEYPGGFVLFGGRLSTGDLSNELWLYDVVGGEWTKRAASSPLRPPPLASHTLTLADNGWIYLLGGVLSNQRFSSSIYRIKLSIVGGDEVWEEVHPRGGKESDVRLVGHTTVYLAQSGSLLVYGGIAASSRFSRLSDRLYSFIIDSKHWTEIHYPRSQLRDTFVPSHRAFHSATVIGNYVIVFGGYTHRHNKEEICYDNQMFLYHLGCHTWVNHDILGTLGPSSRYPKRQGVFGHGAAVRNGNTLLLVGGYHGNVNSDLLAYSLPPTLASREGERYEPELMCSRHVTLSECTSDPECGWCSADESCYGRTVGVNCTTNLQTTRCPGICPALYSCHACLVHHSAATHPTASVAAKLRLFQCTWCVQNAKCHHKHDNYGVCGLKEDTPSQAAGWWGDKGLEITDAESCSALDRRPGLTFIKHKHPFDYTHPDYVTIVNASSVDFILGGHHQLSAAEQNAGRSQMVRLKGFLRPGDSWSYEHLKICISYSQVTLKLAPSNSYDLKVVSNFTAEQVQCRIGYWPGAGPTTLPPGRHLVDVEAIKSISHYSTLHRSKIELQHNKSLENPKVFTFEYLEPFVGIESCSIYTNCLGCLIDNKCAWCPLRDICYNRDVDETQMCRMRDEWHYLIVEPEMCTNCSNHVSCEDCLVSNHCEWSVEDARCVRTGRSLNGGVTEVGDCPTACYSRKNCSHCLDGNGRCVWCHATQECFSFSVYTSQYQYGLCREWTDQGYMKPGLGVCSSCKSHTNCSTCLQTLGCGWCYDVDNPILGVCVEGDFTKPNAESCSAELNSARNSSLYPDEAAWSYAQCPDVDECGLGLHDCHPQAKCTNTHGSYNCQCKRGYIGDGKHSCSKTCYNKCVHGYCMGDPHYICQCDLGWTGPDCSTNCGCHNHSNCSQGINICDQCHDWTTGEFCQFCKPGSYGNATSQEGCRRCNCNDHGNADLDVCNPHTGVCFCKDNTEGASCDKCKKGFYGDPRRGGTCYYECRARGMLKLTEPQGLGSRLAEVNKWSHHSPSSSDCLWIISPSSGTNNSSEGAIIEMVIDSDIKVPCTQNSVYVYDGLPQFVSVGGGVGSGSHQSQMLGVFCTQDSTYPVTVHAKSGHLTVHYKQGNIDEGFNATVSLLSCPNHCPSNRECVQNKCTCPAGTSGYKCNETICPNNCSSHLKQGTCDKAYGRCICAANWGGDDCSHFIRLSDLVYSQIFNTDHLSESLDHLRKMLPRFGHSLLTDRRGYLWLFGGYSLSHGPLNDIRLFDTKNNTWMQVTVDSTNDANMPQGRYFHAAEISQSRREIYIYGGFSTRGVNSTLKDFWKFNLKAQHWVGIEAKGGPGRIAGHSMTLRRWEEAESLIVVGGFNPQDGFSTEIYEFDLTLGVWKTLICYGSRPQGIYGHSTVYHAPSQTFYVYGGILFSVNMTFVSNRLFSFHYPTTSWTVLPIFSHYNPPKLNLPSARYLHSAVAADEYMLVFGGRSESNQIQGSLMGYNYACNHWVRLSRKDIKIIGNPPPTTYAHAMALDPDSYGGRQVGVYIMGGFTGTTSTHVTKILLPSDLCALYVTKDKCRSILGCSYCSVISPGGNSSYCYANMAWRSRDVCQNHNGTLRTSNGVVCSNDWISARSCEQFTSCLDCLAIWPYAWNQSNVCKWCSNCGVPGKCIPAADECSREGKCNLLSREVQGIGLCPEFSCAFSNCDTCLYHGPCLWTRQVLKSPDGGTTISTEPVYAWNCVHEALNERSSYKIKIINVCPVRCSQHTDCKTCLSSEGSEGGWAECRWSSLLSECISPAYQPLYCAGGVCGQVLSKVDTCPRLCSTYTQCSVCLSHAHCGWCSIPAYNTTGQGVCWEGSVDGPSEGKTCDSVVSEAKSSNNQLTNVRPKGTPYSWHYLICPPEDECSNGHHSCDLVSEACEDTRKSYTCVCAEGYKPASTPTSASRCLPVCSQGCVRGRCTAPGKCSCDFGYVGANCSIQCQCNGHSDCAGPDRLDICLDCKNNTQGLQCSRCRALFVGDPSDNGQCVPCSDYCNGHTWLCINDSINDFPFNKESNISDVEAYLRDGPTTRAKCIGCGNLTRGDKCEDCVEGHFRGSEDHRVGCQPCQCHGHGDTCDPVTGERCNCGNNTESEPSCKGGGLLCWTQQCSRCKESYMGTPTEGHQCYKQMSVDLRFCFDSKLIDECKLKPKPLGPKQTVFFAVQPKFLNVDIRITVDVTQGNVDLFMSPRDDTFVVQINATSGAQTAELDPRYRVVPGQRLDGFRFLRFETGGNATTSGWYQHFFLIDEDATGLSTFVKVPRRNTIVMIRNLTNRLVITLPQERHELGSTRFYIAMASADQPAYGTIFFRQDQLHIDLFVFFSVFFSCFFLFLAACVVAWKAKQATEARRQRRRQVVEMMHMAQRPFACVTVLLESAPIANVNQRRSPPRPIAVEPTRDNHAAVTTVFVRLPGGSEPVGKLAMASSLVLLSRNNSVNIRPFLRRRSANT